MSDDDSPSFARGVVTGLAAAGVLVHLWFAILMAPMRAMYADFGGTVPAITRLVIGPAWLWGVPVFGAASVVALIARRPRRLGPYIATALLLVVTVALTWHFAQAPLTALADQVKSD